MQGRPRGKQVQDLMKAWSAMGDGEVIEHAAIETIIGEKRFDAKGRYHGIVQAARKKFLRESGSWMDSEVGVGYRRTTGVQQMEASHNQAKRGVRRIAFGCEVLSKIEDNRLPDPHDRAVRNKRMERMLYLRELTKNETRAIAVVLKPKDLPPPMRIAQ